MKKMVNFFNGIENVIAIPNYEDDVVYLYDCEGKKTDELIEQLMLFDAEYVDDITADDTFYGEKIGEVWKNYKDGYTVKWYIDKKPIEQVLINLYHVTTAATYYDILIHAEQIKRTKNTTLQNAIIAVHLTAAEFRADFSDCIKLQSNTKNPEQKEYALKFRMCDKKVLELLEKYKSRDFLHSTIQDWNELQQAYKNAFGYNNGEIFECYCCTINGLTYMKDNIPYYIEGDYKFNGEKIQCKAPKATIAKLDTLKKIANSLEQNKGGYITALFF